MEEESRVNIEVTEIKNKKNIERWVQSPHRKTIRNNENSKF